MSVAHRAGGGWKVRCDHCGTEHVGPRVALAATALDEAMHHGWTRPSIATGQAACPACTTSTTATASTEIAA